MMPEQFSFSRNKFHVAITAMSLGLLVLLSASLGFGGGAIIKESFGQFNTTPSNGGVEGGGGEESTTTTTSPNNTTTTPPATTGPPAATTNTAQQQDLSAYMMASRNTEAVRGLIGSSLPAEGGNTSAESNNNSNTGHIAVGRFRIFANESLVNRFITEIDLAAIDGTAVHNVTIEETVPHRFELTQSSNTANITTANGSTPSISSNLMTRIYVDSNTPVIDNVSMTISIRGQVLTIEGINIDETAIADIGQRDILSIINGQRIFGIASG